MQLEEQPKRHLEQLGRQPRQPVPPEPACAYDRGLTMLATVHMVPTLPRDDATSGQHYLGPTLPMANTT